MLSFKDWGFSELAVRNIILAFLVVLISTVGFLYRDNARLREQYHFREQELNQKLIECEQKRVDDVNHIMQVAYTRMQQYDSTFLVMVRKLSVLNRELKK